MAEIDFFYQNFWKYWNGALYLVPYLGCLVYLVYKKDKKLMELFVWPFLILLATVYNPFLMRPIIEKMGWEDRYMRFYWLLPAEFLCAYLLARLVNRKAKREVQFAVGVVVLGIVFLCGSSLVKYIPDENVYKIDSWVLETSELIAEASKKENPVILVDQEMYSSIRQYDPTVIEAVNNTGMARYMFTDTEELPVDGQYDDHSTAVSLFVKGVEVDASIMNEIFAERQVDFFVRNTRYYSAEYLQQLDLTYVGAVEGYEVYRCEKE